MIKKLYDKNELWIAISFIVLYCITNIPIRGIFGDESKWMLIANIILITLMMIFIKKYNLDSKYGLDKLPQNSKKFLYFIPCIILGTVNFWGGFKISYVGKELVYASISMILIGVIEEIIFRGFLFKAIEKNKGITPAILITSITFGIGHILNLVAQPGIDTMLQVMYAIAFGFMFVYMFYKSGSLYPCIILHSIINLTSKYGQEFNMYISTVIVIIICVLYTLYLNGLNKE